jgi:Arc/MetJ-type ribon-helix-helix transcriptional regulator
MFDCGGKGTMSIALSPETLKLIEERMQRDGYPTPDDLVRAALSSLDQNEDLDEETLAAIDRAEEQIERGEFRDWKEVSAELRQKYLGE